MRAHATAIKDVFLVIWNGSPIWTKELKSLWSYARWLGIACALAGLTWTTLFRTSESVEPSRREEIIFRNDQEFGQALGDPSASQERLESIRRDNQRIRQANAEATARNKQSLMSALTYSLGWPLAVLGALWGAFSIVSAKPGKSDSSTSVD